MEIITYNETPVTAHWELETIYQRKESNSVTFWTIRYLSKQYQLEVETGIIGGKTNTFYTDINLNNSCKDHQKQALQKAKQKFIKKIRVGYSREEDHSVPIHKPQLAKKYLSEAKLKTEHFEAGIACQAKRDGIRAIATLAGDKISLTTREGNKHHHLEELKDELRLFLMYLPRQCAIDGELDIESLRFNELQSIVMTSNRKHSRNNEVCLYVFDIITDDILEERINILLDAYQQFVNDNSDLKRIKILRNYYAFNELMLEGYYTQFLELGNEGMVMRKLMGGKTKLQKQSLYTHYRNANLIKYKPFDDSDGLLVGIKPGKNKDKAIFVIEMQDGQTFTLKPGTDKERVKYLQYPELFIGKTVTYKYRGFFDSGLPRNPTWIRFREQE